MTDLTKTTTVEMLTAQMVAAAQTSGLSYAEMRVAARNAFLRVCEIEEEYLELCREDD